MAMLYYHHLHCPQQQRQQYQQHTHQSKSMECRRMFHDIFRDIYGLKAVTWLTQRVLTSHIRLQ